MSDEYIAKAQLLIDLKHWTEAEKILRDGLSIEPRSSRLLSLLSICQIERARLKEAEQTVAQAIACDPSDSFARYVFSRVLVAQSKPYEALNKINDAIKLDPTNCTCHYWRSFILNGLTRLTEALAAVNKALALSPGDADGLALKAIILGRLNQQDDSTSLAKTSLGMDADSWYTHLSYGYAQMCAGKQDEAEAALRESLRLNPLNELAKKLLATNQKLRNPLYRFFWTVFRRLLLFGLEVPPSGIHTMPHTGGLSDSTYEQGYELLHAGRRREALSFFSEAYKSEPHNELLRLGLLETLRQSHPFFWLMFALMLCACANGVVLPTYCLIAYKDVIMFLKIFGVLMLCFLSIFMMMVPLTDILLLIHPIGRRAIKSAEIKRAVLTMLLTCASLFFVFKGAGSEQTVLIFLGLGLFGIIDPVFQYMSKQTANGKKQAGIYIVANFTLGVCSYYFPLLLFPYVILLLWSGVHLKKFQ